MKRYLPFAIIGIVLLLAVGASALLLHRQRAEEQHAAGSTNSTSTSGPSASMVAGAEPPHMRGEANSTVTLEEFGDFQCPPCGALHPDLKKIETEYGKRIRVVFRNFPLTQIHANALEAARAAEAAGMQGRFWEMHDWLFENQNVWATTPAPRQLFINQARALGLDASRFNTDMDSATVRQRITQDYRRGASLGVQGTPTLFVNGRLVQNIDMTDQGIRRLINDALNGQG